MKKFSTVLLIAVLAVGFAFADASFTGSANLDFGYNLDSQVWGFTNGVSTDLDWTLTLGEGEGSSVGEGNVYAEVKGSFSISAVEVEDSAFVFSTPLNLDGDADTNDGLINLSVGIDEANIYAGDLKVGILSAGGAPSFAASYYDDDDDGDADADVVELGDELAHGFNFSYKMFNGGVGAEGDATAGTYNVFAWGSIEDYAINDSMTASVAGFGSLMDTNQDLGVAAKFAYTADAMSADFAADYTVDAGLEVAANVTYAPVTFNVYMNTPKAFNVFNLDAKVAATVEGFELSLDGRDLINAARTLTFAENATFGALYQEVSVKTKSFTTLDLVVSEEVTYTADMFEATESLTVEFDNTGLTKIAPELSISTDKIINNATLSLAWTDADFKAAPVAKGAVTASCKIEF